MRRRIFLGAVCFLAGIAALLPLSLSSSLTVADRYYYRYYNDNARARILYDVNASETFLDTWTFSGTLFASEKLRPRDGVLALPEETDLIISGSYKNAVLSAGLSGTAYFKDAPTRYDIAAFVSSTLSVVGDIVTVNGDASVNYDLKGIYAEVKCAPTVSIPASPMVSIAIPITLSGIALSYDSIGESGIAGIRCAAEVYLYPTAQTSFGIRGGYYFSFLRSFVSYPFVQVSIGVNLESGTN